jgi:hypothetical protein
MCFNTVFHGIGCRVPACGDPVAGGTCISVTEEDYGFRYQPLIIKGQYGGSGSRTYDWIRNFDLHFRIRIPYPEKVYWYCTEISIS